VRAQLLHLRQAVELAQSASAPAGPSAWPSSGSAAARARDSAPRRRQGSMDSPTSGRFRAPFLSCAAAASCADQAQAGAGVRGGARRRGAGERVAEQQAHGHAARALLAQVPEQLDGRACGRALRACSFSALAGAGRRHLWERAATGPCAGRAASLY